MLSVEKYLSKYCQSRNYQSRVLQSEQINYMQGLLYFTTEEWTVNEIRNLH